MISSIKNNTIDKETGPYEVSLLFDPSISSAVGHLILLNFLTGHSIPLRVPTISSLLIFFENI